MEMPVVLGIAALVTLVLLRHLAARRVAAGQGQFMWALFLPGFLGGLVILFAAVRVLASAPALGVFLGLAGVIYIAVLVRFLTRLSRAVASTAPEGDLSAAMTEPIADYMLTIVGLTLIGGLIALVGLVIWGLSQAAR